MKKAKDLLIRALTIDYVWTMKEYLGPEYETALQIVKEIEAKAWRW